MTTRPGIEGHPHPHGPEDREAGTAEGLCAIVVFGSCKTKTSFAFSQGPGQASQIGPGRAGLGIPSQGRSSIVVRDIQKAGLLIRRGIIDFSNKLELVDVKCPVGPGGPN